MKPMRLILIGLTGLIVIGLFARANETFRYDAAQASSLMNSAAPQVGAPGWSRGQQNLALGYEDCVRRMSIALQNEGYTKDGNSGGNFVAGGKAIHTAVIICSPAPEGRIFVQIVVASNGDGGGRERQCLQAQMDQPGASRCGYSSAPPGPSGQSACGLGSRWQENEEGWTQVWTRRGNSNVFDVYSTKGSLSLTAVHTVNINGNRVSVSRTNASDGNNCDMEGILQSDGVNVSGSYRCKSGGPYAWQARIICQ